jgi:nitrate/nitrite transporter NarK
MQDTRELDSKQQRTALWCVCLAGFAFSANYTNHAPLRDWLMKSFDSPDAPFTKAMFGFLTTAIFLTHAIMQIPGGLLADKFGPKIVLAVALTIVCVGNFGIAFSGSYYHLLFWKLFTGVGTGACVIAGARYIYQSISSKNLFLYQGYYGASILLGSGFVIFAVPQIAGLFKAWPPAFFATATVAVMVLIAWLFFAPKPSAKEHPQSSLLKMLAHSQLWFLGLVQMASFGLVIVIGSWITTMLKENFSFSNKMLISFIASLVLLLGIFTRPLGGRLVTRIGVRKLLIISLLLNATGCFMLAVFTHYLVVDIIAIVLLGAGCGFPFAGLFNRAGAIFPGRAGAAMGLVNVLGIVFILAGAPLVGKITDWTGDFSAAFISLGIFSLIICAVSLKIDNEQLSKKI